MADVTSVKSPKSEDLFVWVEALLPVNNFSVMSGRFPGLNHLQY